MEEITKNPKWRDTTEPGHSVAVGGAKSITRDETVGIPHHKFEHDLNWPEDTDSRYSPEHRVKMREMVERLRKEQESVGAKSETAETATDL
jgi:hypothetical protein